MAGGRNQCQSRRATGGARCRPQSTRSRPALRARYGRLPEDGWLRRRRSLGDDPHGKTAPDRRVYPSTCRTQMQAGASLRNKMRYPASRARTSTTARPTSSPSALAVRTYAGRCADQARGFVGKTVPQLAHVTTSAATQWRRGHRGQRVERVLTDISVGPSLARRAVATWWRYET